MRLLFPKPQTCASCGQTEKLNSIYWRRMGRVDGKRFYQCECGAGILVGLFSSQHYDALDTRLIIEHIIASGSIN